MDFPSRERTYAQSLAEGHAKMSPEQIRKHAWAMAEIIGSQEMLIKQLLKTADQQKTLTEAMIEAARSLSIAVRQVSSLFVSERADDALALLQKVAEDCELFLSIESPGGFDSSMFKPVAEFWPNWLNPEG